MIDPISYLNQVAIYKAHIQNLTEEFITVWDMATKITSTIKEDAVFASGNHDKISEAVNKLIEQEEKITTAITEYNDYIDRSYSLINKLQNPNHIRVLYRRYFKEETWERIGEKMYMSERSAQRVHGRALQAFSTILNGKN